MYGNNHQVAVFGAGFENCPSFFFFLISILRTALILGIFFEKSN
jgi:hypothetical protein